MKVLSFLFSFILLLVGFDLFSASGAAQTHGAASSAAAVSLERTGTSSSLAIEAAPPAGTRELVDAPQPAAIDGGERPGHVPWAADEHQQPYSRISLGGDISPLGIGIKSAIVLTQFFDARALVNFFNYDSGKFELEGFRTDARLHLLSAGGAVDAYPMNSFWRLSSGLLLANGNQLSAKALIVPGTSFTINGQNYYSSKSDPVNGTGVLGMHRHTPSFLASFGFGKFIPRSNRHWSFPSEFGLVFTGSPTISITKSGSVCTDAALTMCSSVSDTANPVGAAFNTALQAQINKWQHSLNGVIVYPIFSYSAMYSFNVR